MTINKFEPFKSFLKLNLDICTNITVATHEIHKILIFSDEQDLFDNFSVHEDNKVTGTYVISLRIELYTECLTNPSL